MPLHGNWGINSESLFRNTEEKVPLSFHSPYVCTRGEWKTRDTANPTEKTNVTPERAVDLAEKSQGVWGQKTDLNPRMKVPQLSTTMMERAMLKGKTGRYITL